MAIHLIGTACIRHATLTETLAPQCVARISAQQLTTEEKSAFQRLNDRLLAFEQKMLAEMLTIYQGLSCLAWFDREDFHPQVLVYFCLHQTDPQFDEDDNNVLCVMSVDFFPDDKAIWGELELKLAMQNNPNTKMDKDSIELWIKDALQLQHQLAREPHSTLLHHLLREVLQGESRIHYNSQSIGLLDLVRIGELFYQLIPKFAMLEPLQLDYPGWLHKFAKEAKPYHVPCELNEQQLPFRSRAPVAEKPQ